MLVARPTPVGGNQLDLLVAGQQYFPALAAAIEAARHEIFLETYIYADDPAGQRITAALCAAARRGVAVHVLVDGFGARDMAATLSEPLLAAGVILQVYSPRVSPLTLRRERLRRMHRKLSVMDGQVAFVGGINLIDDATGQEQPHPRYDYAVRITGPLASQVRQAMARLWRRVASAHVNRRALRIPPPPPPAASCGEVTAALVVRDNFLHRTDIERAYLAAIAAARNEVLIANAYFLPGRRIRRALSRAAGRGVRVVLLLQGRTDHALLQYASRALYGSLLDAGVEIHQYDKSLLHAKVAVIDEDWATVGSSNIDPFSLLMSREANAVVNDRAFASTLRRSLQQGMNEGATVLPPAKWREQPWSQRLRIWLAYGMVRLLMGIAGYGREH